MNLLAILLLGGRSTRFWPLGEKPLLSFCGKTLYEHQLDLLKAGGIREVLVIGQGLNLPALQKISVASGLKVIFDEQKNLEGGMAAALLDTSKNWQGREILIVSGNDVIEQSGLELLLEKIQTQKVDGALLAQKVQSYFPGGYLKTDKDGFVQAIVEKPGAGNEPSDLVNLVFHYHADSSALLAALQQASSSQDDVYEVALTALAQTKKYLAVGYAGYWQALKYPWHALNLNEHFLGKLKKQISPKAQIAESAVVRGEVVIEDGVRIFDHATVVGPVYLGKNAIVGNNALVRESCIEEGGIVGYSTEVARSLWQKNCQTHMNYSGDSVLGEGVAMGAGAITANFRLDQGEITSMVKGEKTNTGRNKLGTMFGAGARLGVGVTVSPGMKIGQKSFVSSQVLVQSDVPDGKFVYLKNGVEKVVENVQK